MESKVQQLVEMARAALRQYKDVAEAAEKFFEGKFDNIKDDDEGGSIASSSEARRPPRLTTPEDEEMASVEDDLEDDAPLDVDDYVDYDSDFSDTAGQSKNGVTDVDPYAGIFFSKDRREEVIEVEEEPEIVTMFSTQEQVKLMTQGQWMKGCPEGGEQSFLFGLYSQLCEQRCPCAHGCGGFVNRKKSDFFALLPDFTTYIDNLRKAVRQSCPRCHAELCLACGEGVSEERGKLEDSLFHCSNLQGVVLGVGLSMIEQMFVEQNQESMEDKEESSRKKRRKTTTNTSLRDLDDDDDMYYASVPGIMQAKKTRGGTGYAGNQKEDHSGQLEAQAAQRTKDEKVGRLLAAVRVYLPNLNREGGGQTSDYMVHPTALAHLRRRFNYVCSTLLRNDSLADMSERHVLYFELLEWLETISSHEALASMMAMPIMAVSSIKSVATKKLSTKSSGIRERTIVYEGSSSPRELLEGIAIQAHAALKGLEGTKIGDTEPNELTEEQKRMTADMKGKTAEKPAQPVSEENQKLLSFCQRILATVAAIDRALRETKGDAFVDRLQASLPKIATSSTTSAYFQVSIGDTDESIRKIYVEWATRVRFEYCDLMIPHSGEDDDQMPHFKFYYNNEARMLANSDIPKRSLAIAKELAILSTNLPVAWDSSIFLRVDETRVDVIKALITGPEGTPYYNGCYLFDIFLGPSYNQSPPSVKYMTTNGGKYRFNPNLYADGKVCLSLLGTWTGPGWVAGKSTLLQVLISIQSMILCDEPYLNEPGWASSGGTPQSRAYSANVRRMVVKTAMLSNLKNPPDPFEDVIYTHFRLKAKSICAQLDDWLSKDDGKSTLSDGAGYGGLKIDIGGSSNGFQKDVEEMKKMLRELENQS
ncbi:ubiquitin conjugating enzyme family protein [Cyathus striatus]|nr:ubiquitin conjugating enzyme family protein [Cyathus striatus]